jgi:outer membrane protein OmpA-like peptidoglycan-associated protein
MKKFFGFICLLMLVGNQLAGQNPAYKTGIVFKKLFLDYQTTNGGKFTNFKDYRHGAEIGLQRMLTDKVALNVPLRYGVVDSHLDSINCIKKSIYSLDAQLQYQFTTNNRRIVPYVLAGVGGVIEDEGEFNLQIPAGLGFYIRLAPKAYINWQSEFRYGLKEKRSNLQHGIGFIYLLGKSADETPKADTMGNIKDTDMDGIADELDLCPNAFGSKDLNGCPDRDGDKIPDYLDKCPETKGLSEMGGCPDSDGDGISDNEDECPKEAGTADNKGCPKQMDDISKKDSDGDGVADKDDKCPNLKGTVSAMGCPDRDGDGVEDSADKCPDSKGSLGSMGCPDRDSDGVADFEDKCPDKPGLRIYYGCPDTDGDGIDDSRDKCPDTAGSVASDGCPEIRKEDRKTLEIAMQAVQFQTGSAVLKQESNVVLNQIVDILERYPSFNMTISGHTDNTGSAPANQTLSERRAKTCYDYLVARGIAPDRLSHAGYGESRPISTNETEKGRSLNRRVEFNLVPR